MESPTSLHCFADCRVDELTSRIMSADTEGFMGWALSCYVCAGVRLVTKRTCIRGCVAVSFGELAIVELAIQEFKEGRALRRISSEFPVYGPPDCL